MAALTLITHWIGGEGQQKTVQHQRRTDRSIFRPFRSGLRLKKSSGAEADKLGWFINSRHQKRHPTAKSRFVK